MLDNALPVEALFLLVIIICSVFLVLLFCLLCSPSSCVCYDMVALEVFGMSVATIFPTLYVAVFSCAWFPLLISRYFALCLFSKPTFRGQVRATCLDNVDKFFILVFQLL